MIFGDNPKDLMEKISKRAKAKRLGHNITQKELAERSGVSLGSIKRFENTGQISLKHLLMVATVLKALEEFHFLFEETSYQSIDEMVEKKNKSKRKRASSNDS
ncbi:MAG: helix-turn-helix transcriptional regulator [Balneolaceae bacterium]